MQEDVKEFLENFDIADNALQMRCLNRWNGRDLREKENLAEHTHLVCACSIKLYDFFIVKNEELKNKIDFEYMIRLAMLVRNGTAKSYAMKMTTTHPILTLKILVRVIQIADVT